MKKHIFVILILLTGCASKMGTQTSSNQNALEEVRIALMDVRQAYSTQKMDLQNLEEKVADLKPNALIKTSSLDARIQQLEKQLANIQTDLHNLRTHANQTSESLLQYRNQINSLDTLIRNHSAKLDEIGNLKTTLSSISKAISKGTPVAQTHRVSSGETLEKIARHYSISVDVLKKMNGLSSDTIMIGQELKIPE